MESNTDITLRLAGWPWDKFQKIIECRQLSEQQLECATNCSTGESNDYEFVNFQFFRFGRLLELLK